MEKCQDNGEHIIVKKKRRSDKMNTMIIILSLLCIDSIKDKGVSNKMGKYMNTVENSQHDKIVKSLSIFKCFQVPKAWSITTAPNTKTI